MNNEIIEEIPRIQPSYGFTTENIESTEREKIKLN
jgi:hypothetical protein